MYIYGLGIKVLTRVYGLGILFMFFQSVWFLTSSCRFKDSFPAGIAASQEGKSGVRHLVEIKYQV